MALDFRDHSRNNVPAFNLMNLDGRADRWLHFAGAQARQVVLQLRRIPYADHSEALPFSHAEDEQPSTSRVGKGGDGLPCVLWEVRGRGFGLDVSQIGVKLAQGEDPSLKFGSGHLATTRGS